MPFPVPRRMRRSSSEKGGGSSGSFSKTLWYMFVREGSHHRNYVTWFSYTSVSFARYADALFPRHDEQCHPAAGPWPRRGAPPTLTGHALR